MNKFLTVSSLMLFWAFFEMSGGVDFVPASAQAAQVEETAPSTDDPFNFADAYVPFSEPIVTSALPVVTPTPAPQPTAPDDIVLASFSSAPDATKNLTGSRTTAKADVSELRKDIRIVAGNRVNLREGPNTGFAVVDTLSRGVEAEVLLINDDDWAHIRIADSGQIGWMAAWLLSD